MGIHPLPFDEARLKFNNCVDEIYFLNNFVYQYAHIEKADFVIIQFPSGLLKYSNRHVNEFGINAYKLSNALPINYFICTTALNYAHPSFISEINTIFRYRYDFEVSAVCITNLLYQGYNLDEKAPSILQIAPSQMQSTINEYPASNDFFIYNLFDENSI